MPDPLDNLEVVTSSRKAALDRAAANERLTAALALKAIVEGAEPREVARRCGFDLEPAPEPGAEQVMLGMGGGLWEMLGVTAPATPEGGAERFAEWLTKHLRARVLEQLRSGDRG